MKAVYSFSFILLLSQMSTNVFAESKEYVDKREYDMRNIKELELLLDHANFEISNSKDEKVRITLIQKLRWGDKSECLHTIESDTRDSGYLKIFNQSHQSRWNFWNCKVDRNITISLDGRSLAKLDLQTDHGSLEVNELFAESLSFKTDHGNSKIKKLFTQSGHISIDHGNLSIENLQFKNMEIRGDHGDLKVDEIRGELLKANWQHGNMKVLQGKVKDTEFHQSHSDLTLKAWEGQSLKADGEHSGLQINKAAIRDVEIFNDHGFSHLDGVSNTVVASSQHGNIDLELSNSIFEKIVLTSDHGNVTLRIPNKSVCDLSLGDDSTKSGDLFLSSAECTSKPNTQIVKLRATKGDASVIGF